MARGYRRTNILSSNTQLYYSLQGDRAGLRMSEREGERDREGERQRETERERDVK